jgi:hypothetical protein
MSSAGRRRSGSTSLPRRFQRIDQVPLTRSACRRTAAVYAFVQNESEMLFACAINYKNRSSVARGPDADETVWGWGVGGRCGGRVRMAGIVVHYNRRFRSNKDKTSWGGVDAASCTMY